MSKKIEVEATQDCIDALVVQEIREMRECLMDQVEIDAFDIVIKIYEVAE